MPSQPSLVVCGIPGDTTGASPARATSVHNPVGSTCRKFCVQVHKKRHLRTAAEVSEGAPSRMACVLRVVLAQGLAGASPGLARTPFPQRGCTTFVASTPHQLALVPLITVKSRTSTLICLYSRCYHADFAWSYRSFERAISDSVSRLSFR